MDTPAEPTLPKAARLLWDLDDAGSRGPKRGLSLDRILEAAIAICDADGYSALSMSRLAKELGFTTMSLYRYVDSKDTLAIVLFDRVVGPPPELPTGEGWRVGLSAWARAEFDYIRLHPWWLDLPLSAPPFGPNNMAWLEVGLQTLAEVPIPEPLKLQLVTNLSLYVIGRAKFIRDSTLQAADEFDYAAMLAEVLDPARYPLVSHAMTSRAFEADDMDWDIADFDFALDRLLDGYEQFIVKHT
ncbi:TetR/AcrR family transcriptional regulator [Nocardia sp. NPDC088792]|uniref:TetR/AcrR family transcriptional regulator n=1 Tax=Nocardia sp. NPDC088792 TaxID=3364332 RepID=UPI0037F31D68